MNNVNIQTVAGKERFVTPINEGAKRVRKLMGDDYITLPITSDIPIDFKLGDYVDIEGVGRFCIIETQYPSVGEDTNSYDYELKFEAQYRKWANKMYKYMPQTGGNECSWHLTASIDVHVEQLLNAINSLGSQSSDFLYNGVTEWKVSYDNTIDSSVAKLVSFDNINIIDAISAIAETFECEWWVKDNILWFGKCEFGDTYVELSRELNAVNINRSATNEKTANRIYPFGSTENLPSTYRKDLIFHITNIDNVEPLLTDASRPLEKEWFDKSLWLMSAESKAIISANNIRSTATIDITSNGTSQNPENVLLWAKELPLNDMTTGVLSFDLTSVLFDVSVPTNSNNVVVAVLSDAIASWDYVDSEGSIISSDSASTTLLGTYIPSPNSPYSFTMPNLKADVKEKIVTTDVEGEKVEEVTAQNFKLKINLYAQCPNNGDATINISTMNSQDVIIESGSPVYSVQNILIEFLSGEMQDNVVYGTLNPTFAKNEARYNILLDSVERELLTTGDTFKINNIKTGFVPVSYFSDPSYANDGEESQVVNAIADGRLMLAEDKGSYIDAYRYDDNGERVYLGEEGYDNASEMPLSEAIEDVVIFEDVKPSKTFEVLESWFESEDIVDDDGTKRKAFRFFLNDDLFDVNNQFSQEYIIEGTDELKIRFSSGKLNGMQFGVKYYNENGKPTRWEISVDEESNLPNQFYYPEIGDTFTMSGLNVSMIADYYIPEAEQELFDTAQDYVKETNIDASSYDCTMMADVMASGDLVLELGQRVLLKENVFFKEGRQSRVIGYEYPLDYPYDNPKYTIGEKASYSRIGDIESKLDSMQLSMGSQPIGSTTITNNSASMGYIIGTNDTNAAPSNTNVFSALRSMAEFLSRKSNETISSLWRFTKGIEIGNYFRGVQGASIDSNGDAEFGEVRVREVVQSPMLATPDFAQGSLLGVGGAIYQLEGKTYAEIDYLTARRGATFAELIIQEYRSVGGALVISHANGEIESVYQWSNGSGYDVYLKEWNDNNQFQNNDLVRCQYWDRTKNQLTSYWVRVVIATNASGVKCLNMMTADLDGAVPQVGDKLVQMGNSTDTTRQGCILLTTENSAPRMAVLNGINSTTLSNAHYKAIYGSLDGFTDPYTGKVLSDYGMWGENAYLHGEFILSSGKNVADLSTSDTNLLVGTNQGTANWLFGTSIASDYTISDSEELDGYKGIKVNRSKISDNSQWETLRYALRPQLIEKGERYHLSFDIRQSVEDSTPIKLNFAICTGSATDYLVNMIYDAISINQTGQWQHCDIDFTPHISGVADGSQVVYLAIANDYLNQWSSIEIVNLKLEQNAKATKWSQAPEDVEQSSAEFKVTAEGLSSRVTSVENGVEENTTAITQNAESISLTQTNVENVEQGLLDTGINIADKEIVVTADNFLVKNNANKVTSAIDKDGNFKSSSLSALDDDGLLAMSANLNNDKSLKWYYENGNIRMEIGWNEDSLMRYYDEDGTMLWKIGSEQGFKSPSDNDNQPELLELWYIGGLEYDWEEIKNMAQSSATETPTTYYKGKSTGKLATTQTFAEGTFVSGYVTANLAPKEIEGGRYWRFILKYDNGVLIESGEAIW